MRLKTIMQQSGASRRLSSSRGPARRSLTWCPGWTRRRWRLGALRGRPVRPGTPSEPPNSLPSRWTRSEALGSGRSPPEPASPPLLPDSKRHAHTLRGEECPGGLAQKAHITHTERTVPKPIGIIDNASLTSAFHSTRSTLWLLCY